MKKATRMNSITLGDLWSAYFFCHFYNDSADVIQSGTCDPLPLKISTERFRNYPIAL